MTMDALELLEALKSKNIISVKEYELRKSQIVDKLTSTSYTENPSNWRKRRSNEVKIPKHRPIQEPQSDGRIRSVKEDDTAVLIDDSSETDSLIDKTPISPRRPVKRSTSMRLPQLIEEPKKRRDDKGVKMVVWEYSKTREEKREEYIVERIPKSTSSWATVRWIHCEGINHDILQDLKAKFDLHPLAIEDVQEIPHRPKLVYYQDNDSLFLILHVLHFDRNKTLQNRQVSMFLFDNTVLSFQEGKEPLDCWNPIQESLEYDSKIRSNDVEYLVYSLVDVVVDSAMSLLSYYGELLEDTELELTDHPENQKKIQQVRTINRELLFIRRILRPMKEVVEKMVNPLEKKWLDDNEEGEPEVSEENSEERVPQFHFSAYIRMYIQDVEDNISRTVDMIDTYKEVCQGLIAVHANTTEINLSKTMYALTVVSTFFMPLTFLAGVYGMNFKAQPEYEWEWGYMYFWLTALLSVTVTFSILKFRKMI